MNVFTFTSYVTLFKKLIWFFERLLIHKFLILRIFQFWFQILPEFPTVLLNFQKRITTLLASNQSILKEVNPEYSLEGLMLKLQYFGHLMWTADSMEKTLTLGKIKSKRRRCQQKMKWLDSITDSKNMNLNKLRKIVKDRGDWYAAVHGMAKSQTGLSDWTTTKLRVWHH